jgi:sulfite reductase beta subunit-like hemoprotein
VVKTIVQVQREYGNRKDRKLSRLKYLVENTSRPWFRNAILERLNHGVTLHPMKEMTFDTVSDQLGWHEQGDGKLFRCIHVAQGRIENPADGPRYRAAFRALSEKIGAPMIVTPNCNLIVADIEPAQREQVDAILEENQVPREAAFTAARQVAHACVALPTCGLSLSESERVFGDVLDKVDDILRDLGLEQEPLLIRMTGCPNGCARPYNSDIAFVGRAPKKYAMYVGGSHRGDRLAGLHTKVVEFDDIPGVVRSLLEDFAKNRNEGESFTDYWGRTQELGPEPDPMQFHVELEERSIRRSAAAAEA